MIYIIMNDTKQVPIVPRKFLFQEFMHVHFMVHLISNNFPHSGSVDDQQDESETACLIRESVL